jgi:hypothetical protein
MRRWVWLIGLCGLAGVSVGHAGPVDGTRGSYETISAGSVVGGEMVPGQYSVQKTFRAGERACVLVIGDHKPVVDLTVTIYDAAGQVVVQDRGKGGTGDFVAAIWYPPRTADYRIEVLSPGTDFNKCYIAIK